MKMCAFKSYSRELNIFKSKWSIMFCLWEMLKLSQLIPYCGVLPESAGNYREVLIIGRNYREMLINT